MTCTVIPNGIVCASGPFKPGDLEPSGYNEYFEWAEVQYKAGLRQKKCGICGKLKWPQSMSEKTIDSFFSKTKFGPKVKKTESICKECENNGV